jgi:hypothetical protein
VWEQVIYRRWTQDLMRDRFHVWLDDQRFDYIAYLLLVSLSYVAGDLVGAAFNSTGVFDRHNAMCLPTIHDAQTCSACIRVFAQMEKKRICSIVERSIYLDLMEWVNSAILSCFGMIVTQNISFRLDDRHSKY